MSRTRTGLRIIDAGRVSHLHTKLGANEARTPLLAIRRARGLGVAGEWGMVCLCHNAPS